MKNLFFYWSRLIVFHLTSLWATNLTLQLKMLAFFGWELDFYSEYPVNLELTLTEPT